MTSLLFAVTKRFFKQIAIDCANQFEVTALRGRSIISDHIEARMVIKLDGRA